MALLILMTGCSSVKGPTAPGQGEMTVTVSVTAYLLKEHRIAFGYDPVSKYVRSIGELAEFGHGSGSGWLYRINGAFSSANRSSGEYLLQDGDSIEWVYTTDLGKELGLDTIP